MTDNFLQDTTPRDRYLSGCAGKLTYPTMGEAKRVAAIVNNRPNTRHDSRAEGYRCKGCGCFHVGRNERRRHLTLELRKVKRRVMDDVMHDEQLIYG